MPIRWDPLLTAATARELDSMLRDARIRALTLDSASRRFMLFMREHTLVFELHPLRGWLTVLPASEPHPEALKYPYSIRSVSSPPDESLLVIGTRPVRGRGEPEEIVLEVIGNRWNALVVGQGSRTIRHVLVQRTDRVRTLAVGSSYQPPAPTRRRGLGEAFEEKQWNDLLESAGDDDGARRACILRHISWTSSLNVDDLLGRDGWRRWKQMVDPTGWAAFLIPGERGPQPYPVPLASFQQNEGAFPSLVEAFRAGRELDPEAEPISALLLPAGVLSGVEARLEEAKSKLRALSRELKQAGDPEAARRIGDLILARLSEIPRGSGRTTLLDFDGEPIEIELDPALAPTENADQCYAEASRLERARERLPRLIRKAEAAVEKWASVRSEALRGERNAADLVGPTARRTPPRSRDSGPKVNPLPYRSFVSTGGYEIRVGRGARQNDDLTFHHSAPTDIWLHVRQSPGAHVILRWQQDGSPPRRDLAEAATLAALHSPARHSGSVPVAWTRRKYVRKPRGSSAGTVIPERTQTVFVAPDPGLIDRLSAKD